MRVAVFSSKAYTRRFAERANATHNHELTFLKATLDTSTCSLGAGFPAICAFVNDHLDAPVLRYLAENGTRLIALRCAGFNNVNLQEAHRLGLTVARVPAYSPYAVAEHTVGLMLALNREIHRAHNRVREGNFELEGLLGFDMHGRTAGVIGTGKVGAVVCRILSGFGCRVLAYDVHENPKCAALGVEYVPLETIYRESDIVTLHCPLLPQTHHLINKEALAQMKEGVMLVNTSRGALIDTLAVIEALKDGHVGYLALDVYEEEDALFFDDLSGQVIQDDVFARLLTFPNVIVTGHQAFFTAQALENIAETTLANITAFEKGEPSGNEVTLDHL